MTHSDFGRLPSTSYNSVAWYVPPVTGSFSKHRQQQLCLLNFPVLLIKTKTHVCFLVSLVHIRKSLLGAQKVMKFCCCCCWWWKKLVGYLLEIPVKILETVYALEFEVCLIEEVNNCLKYWFLSFEGEEERRDGNWKGFLSLDLYLVILSMTF